MANSKLEDVPLLYQVPIRSHGGATRVGQGGVPAERLLQWHDRAMSGKERDSRGRTFFYSLLLLPHVA
jgi:hypothetical protein